MKKIVLISSLLLIVPLFSVGCDKSTDEAPPDEPREVARQPQSEPGDMLIEPGIGVGRVKFGMTVEQMKDVLGEPDVDATGISLMYQSLGIEIIAKDQQTIVAIVCGNPNNVPTPVVKALQKACKFKTAEGVGIGSTDYEVIDLLGEPTSRTEKRLLYKDKKMFIGLAGGEVIGILLQK